MRSVNDELAQSQSDSLSSCSLALPDWLFGSVLQWFTLKDIKSGKVHLILEWVPTVAQPLKLDQVGPPFHSPLPPAGKFHPTEY